MFTKQSLLKMLDESGGITSEYPFIEYGQLGVLHELIEEGYVERRVKKEGLDEIHITAKGRDFVAKNN